MTNNGYFDYAQSLIGKYHNQAEHYFNREFRVPTLIFRKKGSVAGTAHLQDQIIKINSDLTSLHGYPFLDEVIPHELAHLLAYQLFGRVKPHGNEWKHLMQDVFGCAPKRTHSFDVPKRKQLSQFLYKCDCQTHYLSSIRHHRILKGLQRYSCRRCHAVLSQKNREQ